MGAQIVQRARAWRVSAALGGVSLALGTAMFGWALAGQGLWSVGYVSEAGVAGQPHAGWYRAGLLSVAAGLALLAAGLRGAVAGRLGFLVAALVGCSGLFAAVSASVTCTPGCPLPPHEPATARDLGHAAASVVGVAASVGAQALLAVGAADSPLGRLSRRALWFVLPLVGVAGVALVGFGRGELTGLVERLLLLAVTGWAVAAAVVTSQRR